MPIHNDVKAGNLEAVRRQLDEGIAVDARDANEGLTPLMVAVDSEQAGVEMVRLLIGRGADVNALEPESQESVLALAVREGALKKVEMLLDAGADIGYRTENGYDVTINAVHSRAMSQGAAMMDLLELLIARGAPVLGESDWSESALSVASHRGRFDVVARLLAAGADESRLEWNDLLRAVALGSAADVARLLEDGAEITARDRWERTPWLLSLQLGDGVKAQLLLEAGAQFDDSGNCGQTPLMHAIEGGRVEMLSWLLERGADPDAKDEFGGTALMMAAGQGATPCVRLLLEAGARADLTDKMEGTLRDMRATLEEIAPGSMAGIDEGYAEFLAQLDEGAGQKAIDFAANLDIVRLLVVAGEELGEMNDRVRAMLLGLETEGEVRCLHEQYLAAKYRRFGTSNPEKMDIPFWKEMVRSGVAAYAARATFDDTGDYEDEAVWSYARYGKSITELPDGRIIEIGGEHEDSYDTDFCIYNDVFVHYGAGKFDILGYPETVFPPTDFHSATLVGEFIIIIGCLGYPEARVNGETPVYRLHCDSLSIEKVETSGDKPGWIGRHRAVYEVGDGEEIRIWGGKTWEVAQGETFYEDNPDVYILNLDTLFWQRVEA